MKDITMTAPAADTTATAIVAMEERADLRSCQLAHALLEQAEAQNRIAKQLGGLNNRLASFESMMYAYMHENSISLDGINQSLGNIADNTR